MTSLLGDLRNFIGTHHKEDFEFLKDRVLIIEPDDDKTFTDDIKEALINIMTEPKVIRKVEGGHLAKKDTQLFLIDKLYFIKLIKN